MTTVSPLFSIRECAQPDCQFRFPLWEGREKRGEICPLCGAKTSIIVQEYSPHAIYPQARPRPAWPIRALLDNIRSLHNVGSIFRSADGAGITHLHLCGVTATPDNPRLAKTALGAEKGVQWTYHRNGLRAAAALKEEGNHLWAIEGGSQAQTLFNPDLRLPEAPLALVVGNELAGIDPHILELCDKVLAIPMQGSKNSLNVAVTFGIAAYHLQLVSGRQG